MSQRTTPQPATPFSSAPLPVPGTYASGPPGLGTAPQGGPSESHNLAYNIISVLIPPLAVGLKTGDGW